MGWFRRRPALTEILTGEWRCASCEEVHTGLMDIAALGPDPWPLARDYEPNSALRTDENFLSEDFCVLDGRHFLIRCVLEIPVHGIEQKFAFGCWSTLSRENFDKYVEGFDEGHWGDDGPWTGWLCNQLETYIGDKPEGVLVYPQPGRQRPTLVIANPDHALAVDQDEGITPERLLDILRYYGHAPKV